MENYRARFIIHEVREVIDLAFYSREANKIKNLLHLLIHGSIEVKEKIKIAKVQNINFLKL